MGSTPRYMTNDSTEEKYNIIKLIRYPDIDSRLANESKFGIVTSQLHRFARRCTHVKDFIGNVSLVFYRMAQKHYPRHLIWKPFKRFLRDHPVIYGGKPINFFCTSVQKLIDRLSHGEIVPGPYGLAHIS